MLKDFSLKSGKGESQCIFIYIYRHIYCVFFSTYPGKEASVCVFSEIRRGTTGPCSAFHINIPESTQGTLISVWCGLDLYTARTNKQTIKQLNKQTNNNLENKAVNLVLKTASFTSICELMIFYTSPFLRGPESSEWALHEPRNILVHANTRKIVSLRSLELTILNSTTVYKFAPRFIQVPNSWRHLRLFHLKGYRGVTGNKNIYWRRGGPSQKYVRRGWCEKENI